MIFGPDDLRAIAECDARAGEPLGKALRWAADEIERLRAMPCPYVRTGDEGTSYCSLGTA